MRVKKERVVKQEDLSTVGSLANGRLRVYEYRLILLSLVVHIQIIQ